MYYLSPLYLFRFIINTNLQKIEELCEKELLHFAFIPHARAKRVFYLVFFVFYFFNGVVTYLYNVTPVSYRGKQRSLPSICYDPDTLFALYMHTTHTLSPKG
jgi:hypothetical protein